MQSVSLLGGAPDQKHGESVHLSLWTKSAESVCLSLDKKCRECVFVTVDKKYGECVCQCRQKVQRVSLSL